MIQTIFLLMLFPFSLMATPLPSGSYAYAPMEAATDNGVPINLDIQNEQALIHYFSLNNESTFLLVPGYSRKYRKNPHRLDDIAKKRLEKAYKLYCLNPERTFFILSGGNVWPQKTPFNESLEMKRHLLEKKGVSEKSILIEPYARNSVTNLRNSGRLLHALKAKKAKIVTSPDQQFYFSYPLASTLALRAKVMLGGMPGSVRRQNSGPSLFFPYARVMVKGSDKLDP